MPAIRKLTLIWNADSGALAGLADVAKKLAGVESCELCAITHGALGERSRWRECRASLAVPVEALHRDDVPPELAALVQQRMPCVVASLDDRSLILVDPAQIAACHGDPEALTAAIRARAADQGLTLA